MLFYVIKCAVSWGNSNKKQKSRKGRFHDSAWWAIKKTNNKTHQAIQVTFGGAEKDTRELIKRGMMNTGGSEPWHCRQNKETVLTTREGRGESQTWTKFLPSCSRANPESTHLITRYFSNECYFWVRSCSLITFRMVPQHSAFRSICTITPGNGCKSTCLANQIIIMV